MVDLPRDITPILDSRMPLRSTLAAVALAAATALSVLSPAALAQPTLVTDLNPGASGSFPRGFYVLNQQLYMPATREGTGRELFRYNGDHTALATDIGTQLGGANPYSFAVANRALYFLARQVEDQPPAIWRFNGRETDGVWSGGNPANLTTFQGKLYFSSIHPTLDTAFVERLWVVDGLKIDLVSAFPDDVSIRFLEPMGGYLYAVTSRKIPTSDPLRPNAEFDLMRWDGRSARAEKAPGVPTLFEPRVGRCINDYDFLKAYNGRLYYEAPDFKLYAYDGTAQRAVFTGNVNWKGGFGGRAFFTTGPTGPFCSDEIFGETALLATDGTHAATKLADLGEATFRLDQGDFVPFKQNLYFHSAATAAAPARQLWRFTGDAFERVSNRVLAADTTAKPLTVYERFGNTLGVYKGQLYGALEQRNLLDEELFRYAGHGPVYQSIPTVASASMQASMLDAEQAALETGFDIGTTPTASAAPDAVSGGSASLALVSANPSRTVSRFRVTLAAASEAHVAVYDALGREVARLHDGPLASGTTDLSWTDADAASGVYAVRADVAGVIRTALVVRVR